MQRVLDVQNEANLDKESMSNMGESMRAAIERAVIHEAFVFDDETDRPVEALAEALIWGLMTVCRNETLQSDWITGIAAITGFLKVL